MMKTKTPYSSEEKSKMDAIMGVFSTYIKEHYYFDILYSEKCGYIYIAVDEDDVPCEIFEDSSALLNRLFMEVSSDVRELKLEGDHTTTDLYPQEIAETRNRLEKYFESLEPELKEFCLEEMECFLEEAAE